MYGLRHTVSLLLLAFGGLLVFLGVISLVASPPSDVPPHIHRATMLLFTMGGVIGLAMMAGGIFLRSPVDRGSTWPLWVIYAVLLMPLVGLGLLCGNDVVGIMAQNASSRELAHYGGAVVFLLAFLLGPLVLPFMQPRKGESRVDDERT